MKLRVFPHAFLVSWLTLVAFRATGAEFDSIDLHSRTAADVLPVLRPVAGTASLSGIDYKLFVRCEAADVAHVRQWIF